MSGSPAFSCSSPCALRGSDRTVVGVFLRDRIGNGLTLQPRPEFGYCTKVRKAPTVEGTSTAFSVAWIYGRIGRRDSITVAYGMRMGDGSGQSSNEARPRASPHRSFPLWHTDGIGNPTSSMGQCARRPSVCRRDDCTNDRSTSGSCHRGGARSSGGRGSN